VGAEGGAQRSKEAANQGTHPAIVHDGKPFRSTSCSSPLLSENTPRGWRLGEAQASETPTVHYSLLIMRRESCRRKREQSRRLWVPYMQLPNNTGLFGDSEHVRANLTAVQWQFKCNLFAK